MEDLSGRQFGPYRIVAPLGEGGMAVVYRAHQPTVDRTVALKILPSQLALDPEFVGRFRQEARLLANLQHVHILPVHDFGECDGYTYIVMPYVETGTLAELLGKGPLPWPTIQRIIAQVAGALDYAHSCGIIHRDIKPKNILINQQGDCLLTDFGIAKIVEGTSTFTQLGGTVGTPAYMSPEQIRGEKLDGRSDLYSLGAVLYEMAAGRPPFVAETPLGLMMKHLNDPLPPPRTHNAALPEGVERVILKALTKDRDGRFETATALADSLAEALAGRAAPERRATAREAIAGPSRPTPSPVPATEPMIPQFAEPIAPAEPAAPPARRRFPVWAIGLIALIVTGGLAAGLLTVLGGNGASLRGQSLTFQEGVSPSPAYDQMEAAILANDLETMVNLGGTGHLEVFYGDSENRRSLLHWDLAEIPAGVRIRRAQLELYRFDEEEGENPMRVAVYVMTSDWTEGSNSNFWPEAGAMPDGATWEEAAPGIPWEMAGGDFDFGTDYGHGDNGIVDEVRLSTSVEDGWVVFDVTKAVRAWVEGGVPNHGLMIRPLDGLHTYHYFHSDDAGDPALRPRLVVVHSGSEETP